MDCPSTHHSFLEKLDKYKAEGRVEFDRNFQKDFETGFKLSLHSIADNLVQIFIQERDLCLESKFDFLSINNSNSVFMNITGDLPDYHITSSEVALLE